MQPRSSKHSWALPLVVACLVLASSGPASAQRASLQNIQDQIDELAERLVPVGAILPFGGAPIALPPGFLLCDGSEVLRTDFPDLFAVIGTTHGEGDGSTTFHLPDYRGRFARGVDAGAGRDPESGARTAMQTGGNAGDAVGSTQGDTTASPTADFTLVSVSHDHTVAPSGAHTHLVYPTRGVAELDGDRDGSPRWTSTQDLVTGFAGNHGHLASTAATHAHAVTGGDAETRPMNAAVHWIIKH